MIVRTDLEDYLRTLDSDLVRIFRAADQFERDASDTLSENFQVVAELTRVFWTRAECWKDARCIKPNES